MSSNHPERTTSGQPDELPNAGDLPSEGAARRWRLRVPAGWHLRLILTGIDPNRGEKADAYEDYSLSIPLGESTYPREFILDGNGGEARPVQRGRFFPRILHGLSSRLANLKPAVGRAGRLAPLLLALALLVYASSRLIRLQDYPIYFFTDEANQANLAEDLLRDGLRDYQGHLLPTYFKNVYEYNLSLSVYLQVLPVQLFGKSVAITRAISALVSVIGAAAVGLSLNLLTARRRAWIGVLIFGLAPAWFLHSRTAFETSLMVSCYACFLYGYLLYRLRSPRFLPLMILFAALTFYSYAPGQAVILTSALVLLAVDWRYHMENRRALLYSLPLVALLVFPYVRFQWQYPGKHTEALRILGSYWLQDLPLGEKFHIALENYFGGLNPAYWLTPNETDLARHQMDSFGSLFIPSAPLILLGLVLLLRRWREPAGRIVLLSMLIIPVGAVPAGVGITRLLAFAVPTALLCSYALSWSMDRLPLEPRELGVMTLAVFTLLAGLQVGLLADALDRGPTYSQDYGMNGMQWGASQVFDRIELMLEENPDQQFLLSPTWANGVDVLRRFFLPEDAPVHIANAAGYLENLLEIDPETVFVLTEPEVAELKTSPKIGRIEILGQIRYPGGMPGFTFLHLSYSPDAANIFAAELAERQRPRITSLTIDGLPAQVEYPYIDIGSVELMFDHDPYTLARVYEANPARIVLTLGQPRAVAGLRLTTGSMDFELTVRLLDSTQGELEVLEKTFTDLPDDPTVELMTSEIVTGVKSIVIEIHSLTPGDPFKIHIREIEIL